MIIREYEVKSEEEAIKQAVNELGIAPSFMQTTILKEKKGLFGIGTSLQVEVKIDVDEAEYGLEYLKTVLSDMGIDAHVEVRFSKENKSIKYMVHSEENPLLIGKRGKTLDAFQLMLRQVVNQFSDGKRIITLDIGGYKDQRVKQLEILATKTAKEVAISKIEVTLDPMNSYERRIIHTKLAEWRDVFTESTGEEGSRRVVIKPKK